MRTRTPPPDAPNGWEKSSKVFTFPCTPTEHLTWMGAIGKGKVADAIRRHLNRLARRKAGIKFKDKFE